MQQLSIWKRLAFVGLTLIGFGALLVLAWPTEPVEASARGGVRAVGANPDDYRFVYQPYDAPNLAPEAVAVATVHNLVSGGFVFRSVTCQRRFGADYCAVCFDHPEKLLGAVLVRCRGLSCSYEIDSGEQGRIGWIPEIACGRIE